jgi:hypothetical protein
VLPSDPNATKKHVTTDIPPTRSDTPANMPRRSRLKAIARRLPVVRAAAAQLDSAREELSRRSHDANVLEAEVRRLEDEVRRLQYACDNLRGELTFAQQQRYAGETWVPAGHFYSPIPSHADIEDYRQRLQGPLITELPAIDLNLDGQLELLVKFRRYYNEQPFTAAKQPGVRFYFDNDQFPETDAIFLYCMLRDLSPQRLIEVGAGFSSCVTLDTNERFLDSGMDVTVIDPNPARLLSLIEPEDRERFRLIPRPLQSVPLEEFERLEPDDVLFIDSSHVSKLGSDVNYVFFEILPRLATGVVVHFHDILYPFEYPLKWFEEGRAWSEAYLLRAFLEYNQAFEILLFNDMVDVLSPQRLSHDFPLCTKSSGSIWLRKTS